MTVFVFERAIPFSSISFHLSGVGGRLLAHPMLFRCLMPHRVTFLQSESGNPYSYLFVVARFHFARCSCSAVASSACPLHCLLLRCNEFFRQLCFTKYVLAGKMKKAKHESIEADPSPEQSKEVHKSRWVVVVNLQNRNVDIFP